MSMTLSLHHFVINTYGRQMTINPDNEEKLYHFLWDIIKEKGCFLIRIGGIANHIHLLVDLNPSISVAAFIGELKRRSSFWMKRSGLFPKFRGWGKEYFSFSKSLESKEKVIQYIKNQKEHHGIKSYEDEIRDIIKEEGMTWDDILLT